jgi:hypothetical protein
MSDYTAPTGNHWVDAVHQRLDTGCYGPGGMSVNNNQLFVQLSSGPQARALATSVAGSGAIGERCEDGDAFRTFFLALVGAPIVVTWTVPLPVLLARGAWPVNRSPRPGAALRWEGGMTP